MRTVRVPAGMRPLTAAFLAAATCVAALAATPAEAAALPAATFGTSPGWKGALIAQNGDFTNGPYQDLLAVQKGNLLSTRTMAWAISAPTAPGSNTGRTVATGPA